jgi:hypothetical protein
MMDDRFTRERFEALAVEHGPDYAMECRRRHPGHTSPSRPRCGVATPAPTRWRTPARSTP